MLALLALSVGLLSIPQDAFAGFEEEDHGQVVEVHCDVFYEWELEFPDDGERHGYGECVYIFEDEHEEEHDVEVSGEFELTGLGEVIPIEGTFHIEDYYGNAIWIEEEGSLTLGECETEESEETFIPYCLETTGTVDEGDGIFEDLTGTVEREASGYITHLDFPEEIEGFAYSTIWIFFDEEPQVVEVHCEVFYEFEMIFIFGEREGYGECIYLFSDGSEEEHEVEIFGEFVVGSLVDGFRDIEGTFHIEDYDDNALWLFEEGAIEIDCDIETEEEEEEGIPYCLQTEATVEEGEGIFSFLDGSGTRTAEGYFFTEFIFTDGFAYSTIWIFFDCPECEPEEEEPIPEEGEKNGSGCDNCEPPTLGLNKAGDQRMVDGGFTCNGQTIDVENYYTDFPTITNSVGQALRCTFIIYEDTYADNVRHFEFAVGKRVDDYMSDEQGKITWDRDFKLVETVTYDSELFRNVYVLSSLAKCLDASNTATCLKLELSATPKMPLVDEIIVKTNVWDERRNAKQNFYNDGIDFVGYTENPLPFFNVVDGRNGITAIYTTDFTLEDQTHAVDQYGNTWTLINNIWNKDYVMPNMSCNVSSYIGYDRTCPEFALMKQGQALIGEQYFDSKSIQSEVGDYFTYEYPEQTDRLTGTQLG